MKQKFIILGLVLFSTLTWAQGWHNINNGGRSLGIGNAAVALKGIDGAFSNQAGLAYINKPTFIVYGENRFSQSSLFEFSGAFVSPVKNIGQFGVSLHYFGEDLFNMQHIGLSYSRLLFDRLSIGAQFDILNTHIPQYGSRFAFTAEIGFLAEIFNNFHLGFHAYSPLAVEVVPEETIPTIFNLGFSYKLSTWVNIHMALEKSIDFPMAYKFGIEYNLHKKVCLRGGYVTEPNQWTFGIGYRINSKFRIDAAGSYHTELGYSPGISLVYGNIH